jgi:hypothetical protein
MSRLWSGCFFGKRYNYFVVGSEVSESLRGRQCEEEKENRLWSQDQRRDKEVREVRIEAFIIHTKTGERKVIIL